MIKGIYTYTYTYTYAYIHKQTNKQTHLMAFIGENGERLLLERGSDSKPIYTDNGAKGTVNILMRTASTAGIYLDDHTTRRLTSIVRHNKFTKFALVNYKMCNKITGTCDMDPHWESNLCRLDNTCPLVLCIGVEDKYIMNSIIQRCIYHGFTIHALDVPRQPCNRFPMPNYAPAATNIVIHDAIRNDTWSHACILRAYNRRIKVKNARSAKGTKKKKNIITISTT